jgi:hypothetical protein
VGAVVKVMVALADLVLSALDVAVTFTVCWVVTLLGAA